MPLRFFVTTVFIFALGVCEPVFADKPLSLWKVKGKDAELYMLGSIHVMRPDMYPLPTEIDDAYEQASRVVFEIDIRESNSPEARALMQQKGAYPGDQTIYTELSAETLQLLENYAAANQVDIDQFARLKPWILNVTIALIEFRKLGYDPGHGIDLHYQSRALRDAKTVIPLETFEEQIDLLSGDPPDVQELGLNLSLQHLDEVAPFVEELITAWRTGDADGMYEASAADHQRHPALANQFERLLDHRNEKMAAKLRDLLNSKGTYFVVIGALHMGGEKGLINLLRRDYSIQQVQHSPQ